MEQIANLTLFLIWQKKLLSNCRIASKFRNESQNRSWPKKKIVTCTKLESDRKVIIDSQTEVNHINKTTRWKIPKRKHNTVLPLDSRASS